MIKTQFNEDGLDWKIRVLIALYLSRRILWFKFKPLKMVNSVSCFDICSLNQIEWISISTVVKKKKKKGQYSHNLYIAENLTWTSCFMFHLSLSSLQTKHKIPFVSLASFLLWKMLITRQLHCHLTLKYSWNKLIFVWKAGEIILPQRKKKHFSCARRTLTARASAPHLFSVWIQSA